MVQIVERTDQDRIRDQRSNKLVGIANELLGERFKIHVLKNMGCFGLRDKGKTLPGSEYNIFVYPMSQSIDMVVKQKEYLEDAVELAKAYDTSGEKGIKLKKDYPE